MGDIERGSLNQATQLRCPSGFRSDLIQEPGEHRQGIVDQSCGFLVQLPGKCRGFRPRQLERDRKAAVPSAAAVGAEVSKECQMEEAGFKPSSKRLNDSDVRDLTKSLTKEAVPI
jgi:hypothetical protein